MLTRNTRIFHEQAWITLAFFVLALLLAWDMGGRINTNDFGFLRSAVLGVSGTLAIVAILRNWRVGFYFFNVWLLFEDFVRKYMGNGPALFFWQGCPGSPHLRLPSFCNCPKERSKIPSAILAVVPRVRFCLAGCD